MSALTAAREIAKLGKYLMIGTVESKPHYAPHMTIRHENGEWHPRGEGVVATHLPALAITSAALGDPNKVLERVHAGRPLTPVNTAYGWKRKEDAKGGFQPYMTLEALENLLAHGDDVVDVVSHMGFDPLLSEGLYFSSDPSGYDRLDSFPVRSTDVREMVVNYGLEITSPKLI